MKTKILIACLVLCMVSAMIPSSAFAEKNETIPDTLEKDMFEGVNEPNGELSGNGDEDSVSSSAAEDYYTRKR